MDLSDFIVISKNLVVKNPKHFKKLEKKLKLWQRKLLKKGSNNLKKMG